MAAYLDPEEEKRRKVNPPVPGPTYSAPPQMTAAERAAAEARYAKSNVGGGITNSPTTTQSGAIPTVSNPLSYYQGQVGSGTPITSAPQYGTQSAADQLRRQQAWSAVQGGIANPSALTPEQLQMSKNRIANQMASGSTNAERLAAAQAASAGVAGSGASDRRLQELAAMNQARASGAMTDIEIQNAQDTANRRLQYAGLGAETAGQYGRDELAGRSLEEQALMDRMKLSESGRQANLGYSTDLYKFQNEMDLLNRYREQEREDYMPILEEITGKKKKWQPGDRTWLG